MRSRTALEKGVIVMGFTFVIIGVVAIVRPSHTVIFRQSYKEHIIPSSVEIASPERVRFYGLLALALGCGLCWLAYFPKR